MSSFVKAFSAVWLGFVALFFGGGLLGVVSELLSGDPSRALPFLAVTGAALGFVAFFIGMTALGFKTGQSDAAFLRQWVAEQLRSGQLDP